MINQFLKAGGVTNLADFYRKFPTEDHFNHYMRYGGGLTKFVPGGPILPGTVSTAIKDYQNQNTPVAVPPLLARPYDQADNFVGPTIPAGYAAPAAPVANPSGYAGVSIVDMLGGKGKATDFKSRKKLAESIGISGYTGSADQNAQLIDVLNNNPSILDSYKGSSGKKGSGKKAAGKVDEAAVAGYFANQAAQNPFVVAPQAPSIYGYNGNVGAYPGAAPTQGSDGSSWMGPAAALTGAGAVGYGAYKVGKKELDAMKGIGDLYKGKSAQEIGKLIKNRGFRVAGDYEQLIKAGMKPAEAMAQLKGVKFIEGATKDALAAAQQANVFKQTETAMKNALPIAETYANRFKNAKPIIKQIKAAGVRTAADVKALRDAGLTSKEAMEALKGIPMAKVAETVKATGKWGDMFKAGVAAAKEIPWIKSAYNIIKAREYGGPSHENDTYSAGVSYGVGGTFIPSYGEAALPVYNYGNQAMYGMGMAYGGPTYSVHTQYPHQQYVPALDWMADGGGAMSPEQAGMEGQAQDQMQDQQQAQQQAPSQEQVMQEVAQMLQQGAQPQEVLQQLVQMGIPQDQAQQIIQQVMQQMQGGQGQQQASDQGMAYGGKFEVGGEYEMNANDVQRLLNQGYKIEYL